MTAELVEAYEEQGVRMGRIKVGRAFGRVALTLVPAARPGDRLLVHAGVALARVAGTMETTKEENDVPRHSGPRREH